MTTNIQRESCPAEENLEHISMKDKLKKLWFGIAHHPELVEGLLA
jgi:hypothetical protein